MVCCEIDNNDSDTFGNFDMPGVSRWSVACTQFDVCDTQQVHGAPPLSFLHLQLAYCPRH